MKKAAFAVCLASILPGVPVDAQQPYMQQPSIMLGYGARYCSEWVAARQAQSALPYLSWVQGFISALNVANPPNIADGIEPNALFSRIDVYCRQKPFDHVSTATLELTNELLDRQAKSRRSGR